MGLFRSLSGRLLLLTIAVVMLVEVAIFVPSVARFRLDYLSERAVRAEIAAMSVLAAPDGMVSPELQTQLLEKTDSMSKLIDSSWTDTSCRSWMAIRSSTFLPEASTKSWL